jgi:hypothetical protein
LQTIATSCIGTSMRATCGYPGDKLVAKQAQDVVFTESEEKSSRVRNFY